MRHFEIVAHRGVHNEVPENTIDAFRRAIELGADAVELDVRLTSDHIPVVLHYFYLDGITSTTGAIFNFTLAQLQNVNVVGKDNTTQRFRISTLEEVLEVVSGQIGLEIEVKGPEPESAEIVATVLQKFKRLWDTMEIPSYEPMLLWRIQQQCPGLPTDLLFPRSENWMKTDVVTYSAIHRARLANARAVHLHPTQLASQVASDIRQHGIQIHAWDVNDEQSLKLVADLNIPRICTDKFQQAQDFRTRL